MHSDHIKKIITAGLAIATITGGTIYSSSVAMAETIPQKESPQKIVESKSDKNKPIVSGDVTTKENVTIDKQGVTVGDKGTITVKDGSITFPASSNNIIEHKEEKRNLDSINNARSTTSRHSLPVISSKNPNVSIDILEIDEDSNKADCLITVRNQQPNKKIKVDLKLYEYHRFQRWTHTTNKSFNLTTNDQGEASGDFSFDIYTEASIHPGSLIYNADTVIEQLPSEEHNTDPSIDPSTDPSTEHNTDPSPISKDPDDTKDKIIQFKDQNFKNALLACMKDQGLIADDATEINEQQALKLVNSERSSAYKRLINEKIKDISGIKFFKNLTSLNLSHNHISDFSELSELHNLTDLDISSNNIVNSDLSTPDSSSQGKDKPKGAPINDNIGSTLINLPDSIINLKANHINLSDLTWIKHMTNLEQLDVSFNNLKSIHIKDLQLDSLKKLNADVNQITDISSISDLHNLKELDLIDNHIEDLSALQNLSKLQVLSLGKNNISTISSLQQLETLQKLDLSSNNISSIFPLKQLKNLQKLDLSYNNISDINLISDLISNGKLDDINLSDNHVNNIQNLKGVSDKHDIDLYMERQELPTYDFKGQDVSLNDIIKPSESTCWAGVDLTEEDYRYYSPDPLNPSHISIEDFAKPVYAQGASEDDGSNLLTIKKIPRSKKLELGFTDSEGFFGDAHNTHSGSTRYSGGFILDFTKYTDQLINRIKQTDAPTDKQQKIIDKINSGFGDIKEIEADISNLEKEKSDDTYVFVSTQGKSENEKTEILKKINCHSKITEPTFTEIGASLQFHVSMQNLKPKSNVNISYTINSKTNEITGVSTSTGTFEFSVPIEATGSQTLKMNINDFQGWIKKTDVDTNKDKIIQFKDPVLKQHVLSEMKTQKLITSDKQDITEEDASKVTNLTINNDGSVISSLNGIEKFKNLTTLDLSGHQITDITPLKELTNLENLNLNSNQISDITPLKGLANLTALDLSTNKISEITSLKGLTKLTSLGLDFNYEIYDITPLKELTNLTYLGLGLNKISDVTPLKNLNKLTEIHLQTNQISNITPLKDLTNLKQLDLSNNQIKNLECLNDLKSKIDATGQTITVQPTTTTVDLKKDIKGFGKLIFNSDDNTSNGVITYNKGMKNPYLVIAYDNDKHHQFQVNINVDFSKAKLNSESQTDDISGQLEKLLGESTDIKSSNNYKNADKEKQDLYNNAITSGQAVYDKLSSTPEQVKAAAQAIQNALTGLNGDSKSKEKINNLQNQLDTANGKIQTLSGELEKAKQQGTADKATIQSLTEQLQQTKNKLNKLKEEKTLSDQQKQAEIDKLNGQITELGKQIEELNKDKQSLQTQLQQAQNNLSNVTTQLEQLKKEKKAADEKNQQQISSLNNQVEQLNKDKKNLQVEIDSKTAQISSLNKQLEQLKQSGSQSDQQKQAEIDKLNGQISQLTKDKQELQSKLDTANSTIQNLNNELDKAKQQHTTDASTIERLTGELQQAKSTLERIKQDKAQSDQQKQAEIDKLNDQIAKLEKKVKELSTCPCPSVNPDDSETKHEGAIVKPLINEKPEFDLEKYKKEHPEEFTTTPSETGEQSSIPSTPTVNENSANSSNATTTENKPSIEPKKDVKEVSTQKSDKQRDTTKSTVANKDKQTLPQTSDPTTPFGLLGFVATALGLLGFKKKH